MDNLDFKNGNPGAVQFGNFINYYQFHPPEKRIRVLPKNIWHMPDSNQDKPWIVLDVGCNAGDLTVALLDFFTKQLGIVNYKMLGCDIDPILIQRARENLSKSITFKCLDIMSENGQESLLCYLKEHNQVKFDVVFCFSITMWIHLNHGDSGLKNFLLYVSEVSDILVIEPQPWKCYKSAIKRMKLSNCEFPMFNDLKIRQNVEEDIEKFILEVCGLTKVMESERTEWGRKVLFFKK